MRIDHVIYGVRDLDTAITRFRDELGLVPLARATHPGWGTRSAVIPVGYGQFLELLAIADEGSSSPLVKALRQLLRDGDRMAGVCLRPADFDSVVERLGLEVMIGERDEGEQVLRFRRTVVETNPQMPFFIDWQGHERATDERYGSAAPTRGVSWVEVGCDAATLRRWIGADDVPLRSVAESRGPRRFALRKADGTEMVVE